MEKTQKKSKRVVGRGALSQQAEDELGSVHIDRRNVTIMILALVTIGLGFVSLALGGKSEFLGTKASAVLLVIGYLVLVPWAILTGRARRRSRRETRSGS